MNRKTAAERHISIIIYRVGGSPGLVVMGGDSCSESHKFEFWPRILDGHFFTYLFVVKFCNVY